MPEDFCVEELTDARPTQSGDFALYRLTKRGLGTLEAVEAIVERWRLARAQVSLGGLKDRHAVSVQFLTIHRGPHRDLRQTNLELEYLGQSDRPYASTQVTANRFRITLRSMSQPQVADAEGTLGQVTQDGLPNYFDDQRFGSLGESNEFVAAAWIAGDYERALWLALADANPLDRPGDRTEKQWIRDHWGDWRTCLTRLRSPARRDAIDFLANRHDDYRGAITRIPQPMRGMYIAAFQSYLWNRLLAAQIFQCCPDPVIKSVRLKIGQVPFFTKLSDEARRQLHQTQLPLPSARIKLDNGRIKTLVDQSLEEIGLSMREIRIKYPRDSFFSKGWRAAVFLLHGLSHSVADDDLYPDRKKITLQFELPRGSYATILIKRVTLSEGSAIEFNDQADADESE